MEYPNNGVSCTKRTRLEIEIDAYESSGGNMKMKHIVRKLSTYYVYEELREWVQKVRIA
jgi:hypothetical protein